MTTKQLRASLPSAQPSDVVERIAEKWAWSLAEASNAALSAKAKADGETFLPAIREIQKQTIAAMNEPWDNQWEAFKAGKEEQAALSTTQQAQSGDVQKLVEAAGRFMQFYAMLVAMIEIDGDEPIKPESIIAMLSGCGASDYLTAGNFIALGEALTPFTQNK